MNINNLIIIFLMLVGLVPSFTAGAYWQARKFSSMPIYTLKGEISLQSSPKNRGLLPEGTNLYLYRVLPEIRTYIAFINIDMEDVELEARSYRRGYISPISGYRPSAAFDQENVE